MLVRLSESVPDALTYKLHRYMYMYMYPLPLLARSRYIAEDDGLFSCYFLAQLRHMPMRILAALLDTGTRQRALSWAVPALVAGLTCVHSCIKRDRTLGRSGRHDGLDAAHLRGLCSPLTQCESLHRS